MPPSAVGVSWYHTGNNPLQLVDPSPAYLTWPSTQGITKGGKFALCPLGETGQYQVFVSNWNFDQQGVEKDKCQYYKLAALNANPWKQDDDKWGDHHHHDHEDHEDHEDDGEDGDS